MKNASLMQTDPFFLPLLTLLPVLGSVGKLEKFSSSLYARHEKVLRYKEELERANSPETKNKLKDVELEERMLKQVLTRLESEVQ